jgi:pimeloyl-ACP methyl ester carboxylesterase
VANRRLRLALAPALLTLAAAAPAAASAESVVTLRGYDAAGPAKYDKVRVLKQGSSKAHHVLVLAPGTSAGAAYFRPLGADIVKRLPDWQVWSVERRENLLEDHSALDEALAGTRSPKALFDYYLGWISDPTVSPHYKPPADADVAFARSWGMRVAVEDLRRVIRSARKGGREVVLGGHSLGGSIATAYATWDFGGRAGAKDLAGLVLIDGASGGRPAPTAAQAGKDLAGLEGTSPFLDLTGAGLPWTAGAFNAVGSTAALKDPAGPAILQAWPLLPANLKPPVQATNRGGYGFALDTKTGPPSLALVQVHSGHLAEGGEPRDWVDDGLTPVLRVARVFSGIKGMDGTSWFHPRRLSIDSGAVNAGIKNSAQATLGVRATHGRDVKVPIYAFETSLGKGRVLKAARKLARQSGVPRSDLTLVERSSTFAHIDPVAAAPEKNDFLSTLVPFLRKLR